MPLFHCNFFSKILRTTTKVVVSLPSPSSAATAHLSLDEIYPTGQAHQLLYLLHGMNGDETSWLRKTNVERYAQDSGIALVLPFGENSFYTDMAHGLAYFTYLTEELPRFVQANFPVSSRRKDTFIAGLSMGGYGACKAALRYPDRYAAFASLSGAVDIEQVAEYSEQFDMSEMMRNTVGSVEACREGENNLFTLAGRLAGSEEQVPSAYLSCGTEDELCIDMNRRLRDCFERNNLPLTYVERPGGHEWGLWDEQIQQVLAWLPR